MKYEVDVQTVIKGLRCPAGRRGHCGVDTSYGRIGEAQAVRVP